MMKKGIFGRFAVAAAVLLTMSSCLRDDLDDCPPPYNVRLVVVTDYEQENPAPSTRGAAEIDWYRDQIDNVTVYVFDELTGEYVDAYEGPAYTMGEEYIVPFRLEEGRNYSFVAWTNTGDTYEAPRRSNLLTQRVLRDELQVDINVPATTRTFTEDLPHRHFGELDAAAVVADSVNVHKIVISPQTYRLNFIVRGLSAMTDEFGVTVTDRNEQHTFNNTFIDGSADYYHTRTLTGGSTRAAGEIRASMILMQIGDDTQTSFDLKNVTDDESLYANDLLKAIETAYGAQIGDGKTYADLPEMLADKYEYDIILNYSALGVTVEVHPWNYMPNNPGPLD